ncbi:MAG: GPR endopeptidase [Clostridia bacterium]|nr:GPR endopeptidase [Clostridia bacterium]
MSIRTDLVIECREMFAEEICGVESTRHDSDGITVTHVKVTTQEGAEKIGKPIGSYVTIEIKGMLQENEEICERGANALRDELKKLINISKEDSVLVVGLGNRYITPDSIGPKTVGKLTVTRHITKDAGNDLGFSIRPVSAVAPGVLGLTGIETGEIVKGVTRHVNPSLIIAVDALASRNLGRLGTTIQLCDTGISPGSGVGNNRQELSRQSLGVPVVAIGVPMVVDAATLAVDIVESVSKNMPEGKGAMASVSEENLNLINSLLATNNKNMIVTPNDVDIISEQAASIIADGINMALHG